MKQDMYIMYLLEPFIYKIFLERYFADTHSSLKILFDACGSVKLFCL